MSKLNCASRSRFEATSSMKQIMTKTYQIFHSVYLQYQIIQSSITEFILLPKNYIRNSPSPNCIISQYQIVSRPISNYQAPWQPLKLNMVAHHFSCFLFSYSTYSMFLQFPISLCCQSDVTHCNGFLGSSYVSLTPPDISKFLYFST